MRVGLLINPTAGIGGAVALRGSDTEEIQKEALRRGAESVVHARVNAALNSCKHLDCIKLVTCPGVMGADSVKEVNVQIELIEAHPTLPTSVADTLAVAESLISHHIDLLLFAGGDGTARDLLAIAGTQLTLGIPCGVKMHSGVFAITPEHVGGLLDALVLGGLVNSVAADVRDVDEDALNAGRVASNFYGEMMVPNPGAYLQHTKIGGREDAALAVEEIVADVYEKIETEISGGVGFLLGPGSTLMAIKNRLNIEGTLMGFDFVQEGEALVDLTEKQIYECTRNVDWKLVVSFSRGQGFLFGRGNQQVSARILKGLSRQDLWIVTTREKLKSLEGRPLLVDTNNSQVDQQLHGLHELVTGYEDRLLYRVGNEY